MEVTRAEASRARGYVSRMKNRRTALPQPLRLTMALLVAPLVPAVLLRIPAWLNGDARPRTALLFAVLATYAVMLLFYLTPIFYQVTAVPPAIRPFVAASPITVLVRCYQQVFYANEWPDIASFGYLFLVSIVLLLLGHAFFKRHKESFGEYL